jgi:hypothetical protein
MFNCGLGLIVTMVLAVAKQPKSLYAVTVYVPDCVGFIVAVFAAFDQLNDVPPDAVRVIGVPSQAVVLPVICTDGFGADIMLTDDVAEQPFSFVTVTLYIPDALTSVLAVVAPLLHTYPVPPVAVRVVLSPPQIAVVPVIAGEGKAFTVTYIEVLAPH